MTMENLSVGSEGSSNQSAPAAPATSEGSSEVIGNTQNTSGESQDGKAPAVDENGNPVQAAPAYTPNFKFKVMKKEMEIDELFKGVIKDADTEKKVKELHERAHGLDVVKGHLQREMESKKQIEAEYTQLNQNVGRLLKYRDSGDLDSFFEGCNLKEEQILRWVQKKLDEATLPAETKAEMQRQRELSRRAYDLEDQNQGLMSKQQQIQISERTRDMEAVVARPEISSIAQAYDAALGTEGAFYDLVSERGSLAWHQKKVDLTSEQAVQEAVNIVSKLLKTGGNLQGQQPNPMPVNGGANGQQSQAPQGSGQMTQKPTLPNVGSRATSPVKKAPESLDDLKKLAKASRGE